MGEPVTPPRGATKGAVIDLTPRWQAVVTMVRRFTADSRNAAAASALLDELNRLAVIADGDDPEVELAAKSG